jgi:AmmeMemoRadiSam system protein A
VDLTEKQGQILVQLAYCTISEQLGLQRTEDCGAALEWALQDPVFATVAGVFVTLKKDQNLRGCIGNLVSENTITEGVRANAINAAFNDYRFKALTAAELEAIEIEVSVLTPPQKISYTDWHDLVTKLRIAVDGVILCKGGLSATFLPQVWQQLPQIESFLSQLCRKAGLASESWMTEPLDIQTYQVQSFSRSF